MGRFECFGRIKFLKNYCVSDSESAPELGYFFHVEDIFQTNATPCFRTPINKGFISTHMDKSNKSERSELFPDLVVEFTLIPSEETFV